ncbi:MAG: HAD family hydrolase [Sphingomicrobium sp.]
MNKFDHVIFDLDGTLVDSALVCSEILTEMLGERRSDRVVTVECARAHMSLGGAHLVQTMLGDECGDVEAELCEFRRRYAAHPTPDSSLFDGVRYGLIRLHARGLKLGICSNKPQYLCEKVLADLGLLAMFDAVIGTSDGRKHKPHPQLMNLTLHALNARAEHTVFVGDSDQDHELALATGVPFRFVGYGYRPAGWAPEGLPVFDTFAGLVGSIETELERRATFRRVA